MTERLSRKTVTFAHPFSLNGIEETFPPGTYAIEVTEEQLNGLSFIAYRRLTTTIALPSSNTANISRQLVEIDPEDLKAALARDAGHVMANPKFKVGEMVDLMPSRAGVPASGPAYKILRLLPQQGGEHFYGIKTILEAFERIVKESKLVRTRQQTEQY